MPPALPRIFMLQTIGFRRVSMTFHDYNHLPLYHVSHHASHLFFPPRFPTCPSPVNEISPRKAPSTAVRRSNAVPSRGFTAGSKRLRAAKAARKAFDNISGEGRATSPQKLIRQTSTDHRTRMNALCALCFIYSIRRNITDYQLYFITCIHDSLIICIYDNYIEIWWYWYMKM